MPDVRHAKTDPALIGAIRIPIFLVVFNPLCTLWCHCIEAHVTPDQRQSGTFISGYYAISVVINLAAIFATVLVSLSTRVLRSSSF
jgi:hypothetical protein